MKAWQAFRERFAESVATMSSRDRRLFVGLVAFVMVALLGGTWWITRGMLADMRSRVADREQTLATVQDLASQQKSAAAQVSAIEDELRKNAGQDLPAIMEKVAAGTGISSNLAGVREKEITNQGTLEEKTYNVDLNKITTQQLTDFLYEAETGGYPLRVRSMKTKTVTSAGVKVLNVSLEVSAFRLLEEAAAAAGDATEKKP
jgi:type II secretory pathway component PulM